MINRNKELSDDEKKEIQNTLDVIDISIYDLLVKRQELKAEIENKKISISDLTFYAVFTTKWKTAVDKKVCNANFKIKP